MQPRPSPPGRDFHACWSGRKWRISSNTMWNHFEMFICVCVCVCVCVGSLVPCSRAAALFPPPQEVCWSSQTGTPSPCWNVPQSQSPSHTSPSWWDNGEGKKRKLIIVVVIIIKIYIIIINYSNILRIIHYTRTDSVSVRFFQAENVVE